VIADNRAAVRAGALYASASSPRMWHTTIARNVHTNGVGVYATDASGTYSSVAMTNTVLVSQSVGVEVDAGSAATLNGVLWFGNTGGNTSGPVTVQNGTTGDPAFAADGYHLTSASQAIDRGVVSGVGVDVDGDARPQNGVYDLGADEYVGTPSPPTAGFDATPRSGTRPLTVTFTDQSLGSVTMWLWRFGDGATSAATNPTHSYTRTGVFTVSLHVTGPGGSHGLTRTHYITVTEPPLPVSYTLTIAQAGDGSGLLTPTVGTHTYLSGTTAVVTATPTAGSNFAGWSGAATGTSSSVSILMDDDKTLTATFTLTGTCTPISGVSFDFTPAVPHVSETVRFTATVGVGTATPPITYTWMWGDGSAETVGPTPVAAHAFPFTNTRRTYTVTLTVANACPSQGDAQRTVSVVPYGIYLPLVMRD
jgi:uncharacterized repeat protein (TIGR02543 family)